MLELSDKKAVTNTLLSQPLRQPVHLLGRSINAAGKTQTWTEALRSPLSRYALQPDQHHQDIVTFLEEAMRAKAATLPPDERNDYYSTVAPRVVTWLKNLANKKDEMGRKIFVGGRRLPVIFKQVLKAKDEADLPKGRSELASGVGGGVLAALVFGILFGPYVAILPVAGAIFFGIVTAFGIGLGVVEGVMAARNSFVNRLMPHMAEGWSLIREQKLTGRWKPAAHKQTQPNSVAMKTIAEDYDELDLSEEIAQVEADEKSLAKKQQGVGRKFKPVLPVRLGLQGGSRAHTQFSVDILTALTSEQRFKTKIVHLWEAIVACQSDDKLIQACLQERRRLRQAIRSAREQQRGVLEERLSTIDEQLEEAISDFLGRNSTPEGPYYTQLEVLGQQLRERMKLRFFAVDLYDDTKRLLDNIMDNGRGHAPASRLSPFAMATLVTIGVSALFFIGLLLLAPAAPVSAALLATVLPAVATFVSIYPFQAQQCAARETVRLCAETAKVPQERAEGRAQFQQQLHVNVPRPRGHHYGTYAQLSQRQAQPTVEVKGLQQAKRARAESGRNEFKHQ